MHSNRQNWVHGLRFARVLRATLGFALLCFVAGRACAQSISPGYASLPAGSSGSVTYSCSGGDQFIWMVSGGSEIAGGAFGDSYVTLSGSGTSPGSYSVNCLVYNDGSFVGLAFATFEIIGQPQATVYLSASPSTLNYGQSTSLSGYGGSSSSSFQYWGGGTVVVSGSTAQAVGIGSGAAYTYLPGDGTYDDSNTAQVTFNVGKAIPNGAFSTRSWPGPRTVAAGDLNASFSNPFTSSGVIQPTAVVTYSIVSATGSGASPTSGPVVAGTVFQPGTYSIRATYPGDSYYNSTSVTATWTVTLVTTPATFTAGVSSFVYNGSQQPVTVTPAPAGATFTETYAGTAGTVYPSSSTAPTGAGSYTVTAAATGSYSGSAAFAMTIAPATPTLSWSPPAGILTGTALSSVQLDATSSAAGSFAYSPASGTVLSAGINQPLTATFTPFDTVDFVSGTTVGTTITVTTPTYTLSVACAPSGGGSATGGGTAAGGTSMPIVATPAAGYIFTGWSPSAGLTNPAASSTSVALTSTRTVTANFSLITASSSGTITFAPAFTGAEVTTSTRSARIANAGTSPLVVSSLQTTGDFVPTVALPLTIPAASSVLVPVIFEPQAIGPRTGTFTLIDNDSTNNEILFNLVGTGVNPGVSYTVTVSVNPLSAGSVSGAGVYNGGDPLTVSATPSPDYTFTGFSGDITSASNPYISTVTGNLNLVANFSATSYTLTTNVSGAGTVSPSTNSYSPGTIVSVSATPSAGNTFVGWTGDVPAAVASAVPEPSSFTIPMNGNYTLTADFTAMLPQTITFPAPNGGVPVVSGNSYPLNATASSGLAVTYKIISGPATISGSTLSITGTSVIVIEANQAGNATYLPAPAVQITVTPFVAPRSFMNFNSVQGATGEHAANSGQDGGTSSGATSVENSPGSPFYGTPTPAQKAAQEAQAAAAAAAKADSPGPLPSGVGR